MKRIFSSQRFLVIYSGVLTGIFAIIVFGGFVKVAQKEKASFDEITVNRINVTEADGTLRLVISNKASFPGMIVKGKEYPHPRNTGGVLFFNDEGTENGGLVFGGAKDKEGKVISSSALTFDQYMQDQVISMGQEDENGKRTAQVKVWDRPDYPITELIEEWQRISKLPAAQQEEAKKRFLTNRPQQTHLRLAMGREMDHSVGLRMKDPEGRDRIVIMVKPDGNPVIQFLDAQGKMISQLPQETSR